MDEQALRKYVRLVLERSMGVTSEDQVLQKINRGNGGSLPVGELSPEETVVADDMVKRGLLRRVGAGQGVSTQGGTMGRRGDHMAVTGGRNVAGPVDPSAAHRYPERYVVTSGGSHAAGTFASDTFHDEKPEIRRARRDGTLKTKKW